MAAPVLSVLRHTTRKTGPAKGPVFQRHEIGHHADSTVIVPATTDAQVDQSAPRHRARRLGSTGLLHSRRR